MTSIINCKGVETKIFAQTFEYDAYEQIKKLCNFEAYQDSKIRIMPDAHAGKGCTVGTTMTISDKVTPNLVGVDIGCGMLTIPLVEKKLDFKKLDKAIHELVPSGFEVHKQSKKLFPYEDLKCVEHVDVRRASLSIGTLGGGNHFIEIDKSEKDGTLYLVIHSGSRKLGTDVCKYYQDLAFSTANEMCKVKQYLIKRLKKEKREKDIDTELKKLKKPSVDKELAFLSDANDDLFYYLKDMSITQKYAELNRKTIAQTILDKLKLKGLNAFDTIHNYIDFDNMILRKGAVSAKKGELLLIPINMRDGSLICIGKGNEDWNYSAPHGAGRLMSRGKAKSELSLDEFTDSMKGIYTTSVGQETLDEAPQAYKTMDEIVRMIEPTVDIIDTIKPVYNFKAH